MSAHAQPRLSEQEYLEAERKAEFRHQFYDGIVYAMSGGSPSHAFIIASLSRELGNALKKRPCQVASSDLRIRVSESGLYTYPDVVVVCGDLKFADDQRDTVINPALLIEVLSPSTEAYDRGFKSEQYRKLESLQEYALVSQAYPHIEIFRRQATNEWLLSEFNNLDQTCHVESVGCSIPLAEIYDKIKFEETPFL
ncbi:MAG: Uma2 family endonuclease [Bryobacteraceae bacterium]